MQNIYSDPRPRMSEDDTLIPLGADEYIMRFPDTDEARAFVAEVQARGAWAAYLAGDYRVVLLSGEGAKLPLRLIRDLKRLTYQECDFCGGEGEVTYLEGPGFESKVGFGYEPNERTVVCPKCHGAKMLEVVGP